MKSLQVVGGYRPVLTFLVLVSIVASSCTKDESEHRRRRTGTETTAPPAAPSITLPPVLNPLLRFDISWEQSDALVPRTLSSVSYNPNSIENPGTGPRPVITPDPFNSGNKVLKITVDENNRDGDRIRSELTAWNLNAGMRQQAAYGFRFYIPTAFQTDQRAMNFIQLHSVSPFSRIPAIAFMLKQKQLDVNIAWATSLDNQTHQGDVHKFFDVTNWFGRWVNVVMIVNWYPDSNGYVSLYFDGSLAYTYNGPVGYNGDAQGPYFKWGLHYPGGELPAGSTSTSQTVYYDNIKIGNNVGYAEVQP